MKLCPICKKEMFISKYYDTKLETMRINETCFSCKYENEKIEKSKTITCPCCKGKGYLKNKE